MVSPLRQDIVIGLGRSSASKTLFLQHAAVIHDPLNLDACS